LRDKKIFMAMTKAKSDNKEFFEQRFDEIRKDIKSLLKKS